MNDPWYEDMHRNGWQMPIVSRWKRWPIIRHARAFYHMWRFNRHLRKVRVMRGAGMGLLDTGYDRWVIYGIFHGREGVEQ